MDIFTMKRRRTCISDSALKQKWKCLFSCGKIYKICLESKHCVTDLETNIWQLYIYIHILHKFQNFWGKKGVFLFLFLPWSICPSTLDFFHWNFHTSSLICHVCMPFPGWMDLKLLVFCGVLWDQRGVISSLR